MKRRPTASSPDSSDASADRVYEAPASAHAEAARILADPDSSGDDKVDALWTLGRGAYYSNQLSDAVVYLREALPLVDDPSKRTDLLLTLAPALSKVGQASEALELLDPERDELTPRQRGQLHNQRGIIFTEHGQLADSVVAFELAIDFLREAGDSAGEARALVNIGASVSMMGDQDEAERWYGLGRELATATGQDVVAAGIEGNLGYVASRRGDFATALDWYERARRRFAELGDVDLLVAVLETDHATTLLDVGLDADAAEAARYAVESSLAGGNRMLEVQARVLLGEAQLRLDRPRDAEANLHTAGSLARDLDVRPWALRSEYLNLQSATLGDDLGPDFAARVRHVAEEILRAGWERESLRAAHIGADALIAAGRPDEALALLAWVAANVDFALADPVDVQFSRALTASLLDDRTTQRTAIEAGLAEVDRQRSLLGSAELQVRIGHRARSLRRLAVEAALADDDPVAALLASEASRNRTRTTLSDPDDPETDALLAELRDLRVGRSEAQLGGDDIAELERRIRSVETEILNRNRRSSSAGTPIEADGSDVIEALSNAQDVSFVCYVRAGERLWAVRVSGAEFSLVDIGDAMTIATMVRKQRSVLRRMAIAGSTSTGDAFELIDTVNEQLDRLVIEPVDLRPSDHVVIVPARSVSALGWAGLPSLTDSPFTIAPSLTLWAAGSYELTARSVGIIGGPALAEADRELEELLGLWGADVAEPYHRASVADAALALSSHDAVHIAAHGSFRSDNPYFSAIDFDDGALTLLDLERLPRLPDLVVLASCDGAAAAGGEGSEVVGTTSTMLGLGVSVVIAPTVVVDDAAARRFSTDLHRALADRTPVVDAVCDARRRAFRRGTAGDRAAAMSIQVHGNRATSSGLELIGP